MQKEDKLIIGGHEFHSRFILGSGKYSLKLIEAAVKDAGAEIITLAVRRANTKDQENILDFIPKNVTLLPNTSGARNAEEAVRIARLARELGCGDFVLYQAKVRCRKRCSPEYQKNTVGNRHRQASHHKHNRQKHLPPGKENQQKRRQKQQRLLRSKSGRPSSFSRELITLLTLGWVV